MPEKTVEYYIIKRNAAKIEFVRHQGYEHFWTDKKTEAMVYTKLEVASALCVKLLGCEVITVQGVTAFIRPLV